MLRRSRTGRHRKVVVTLGLGREVLGNQACSVVVKKKKWCQGEHGKAEGRFYLVVPRPSRAGQGVLQTVLSCSARVAYTYNWNIPDLMPFTTPICPLLPSEWEPQFKIK